MLNNLVERLTEEFGESGQRACEDLLCQVVGFAIVTNAARDDGAHRRPFPPDQMIEGERVTGLRLEEQRVVRSRESQCRRHRLQHLIGCAPHVVCLTLWVGVVIHSTPF